MDQVISELITQWGVFGLVVVLVGFIIYDNYKKPKIAKPSQDICVGGCKQGDLIYDSLKDIKESIGTRFDGITASIDAINTKVDVLDEKFETKIKILDDKIQHIPNKSVQKIVENLRMLLFLIGCKGKDLLQQMHFLLTCQPCGKGISVSRHTFTSKCFH